MPAPISLSILLTFAFANGGGEKGGEPLVGMITDVGGIDDKGLNQGTWEGLVKYAEDNKLPKDSYTFLQSETDADYIPNLSTLSDEGYRLIISPGFLFTEAIAEVSQNFPDTHYLIIDTVVEDRPNVASAVFAEEQASFLVGIAAAMKAKEEGHKDVGFIGGMDFPVIQHFEAGFEAGVAAVDPSLVVDIEYAGSFNDTQKGQNIAAKMYDQGEGIIFVAAGGTGNGVIKEAKDRALQGNHVWVIGVDKDQYKEGIYDQENKKSVILTSMMKRGDVAAYKVIEMEAKNQFKGEVIRFDIKNNGVGIPENNPNLDKTTLDEIEKYRKMIANGEITVSDVPKRLK